MLFEVLFVFFILVSLMSSIFLFYALRRINFIESIISEFQRIIEYSSNKLKTIDDSGHFESDDEVGFVFEQIKDLQFILDSLFESVEENDVVKNEEKEKN